MSRLDQQCLIDALQDFDNIFSGFIFDTPTYPKQNDKLGVPNTGNFSWQDQTLASNRSFEHQTRDWQNTQHGSSGEDVTSPMAYSYSPSSIASNDSENHENRSAMSDNFQVSDKTGFYSNQAPESTPPKLSSQFSPGYNPSPLSMTSNSSNPSPQGLDSDFQVLQDELNSRCIQMEGFFQNQPSKISFQTQEFYSQSPPSTNFSNSSDLNHQLTQRYHIAPTYQDQKLNMANDSLVRKNQEQLSFSYSPSPLASDVEDKVPVKYQVAPKYHIAPTYQDQLQNSANDSLMRTSQDHFSNPNFLDTEDKVPAKYLIAPKISLFKLEGSCHVCGEAAGKHTAYGGKVCPSCRAFFRRSVQTRYYEIFSCDNDERCLVDSKTRKSCKFCRFTKCLQANMQVKFRPKFTF